MILISVAVCGTVQGELFVWLSRQQLYVLVYLVTVMHSAQAGYMEKAHKYTEKALAQIDKLTCEYLSFFLSNSLICKLPDKYA